MITSRTPTRNTFTHDLDFSQLRLSIREMANINFSRIFILDHEHLNTFRNNWSECLSTEIYRSVTYDSIAIVTYTAVTIRKQTFPDFCFPTMSADALYFPLSRLANFELRKYFPPCISSAVSPCRKLFERHL